MKNLFRATTLIFIFILLLGTFNQTGFNAKATDSRARTNQTFSTVFENFKINSGETENNPVSLNGKIAFMSKGPQENWQIYTMNPDGSGRKRITNDNYYDSGPAWSPDGSKIALVIDQGNYRPQMRAHWEKAKPIWDEFGVRQNVTHVALFTEYLYERLRPMYEAEMSAG